MCILPFPVRIKISGRRLRLAICSVYGLACISIIVSAVRAALLGINPQSNIKYINSLTMIEVMTCFVIGCIPCISSTFTKKYVYHGRTNSNQRNPYGASGYSSRTNPSAMLERRHIFPMDCMAANDLSTDASYVGRCSYEAEPTDHVINTQEIGKTTTIRVMVN